MGAANRTHSAETRDAVEVRQREKLAKVIETARAAGGFHAQKFAECGLSAADIRQHGLQGLPLTTRAELEADQRAHFPYGTVLTEPLQHYTRLHQTSGSLSGQPLRWLDTPASWRWWLACWHTGFDWAGVRPEDRFAFAFSFGPFIGFWSAFEAAAARGHFCLTAGGMSSAARLRLILENRATVVCCTPTYALRLVDEARELGVDLASSPVRLLIVAGEPGGNRPHTRAAIERGWGARLCDHAGMTEVGAWGFEPAEHPGHLMVNESEFIAESIDPASGAPAPDGEIGELVLTNLGRSASPAIRYRTGDLVRLRRGKLDGVERCWCEGGILGRADDMLVIRGNNVFPAALEDLVRGVSGVGEFRIVVDQRGGMAELRIELEPAANVDGDQAQAEVARVVRDHLHLRAEVQVRPAGSLPRGEMKSRRVVQVRDGSAGASSSTEKENP